MTYIPESLRRQVYARANGKCEYCLIDERYAAKRHEVDHIHAEKHGGTLSDDNLCLSCAVCNRYKGSDIASIDPETDQPVFLYHPRREKWSDHFMLKDGKIVGLTPSGRATAHLLHMNDADSIDERLRLMRIGAYP